MNDTMTLSEIEKLSDLNKQRAPLQGKVETVAKRLFDVWSLLNPLENTPRRFRFAELTDSGVEIEFDFTSWHDGIPYTESEKVTLPFDIFLNPEWEQRSRETIASRETEARQAMQRQAQSEAREYLARVYGR